MAKYLLTQFGGANGELGASLRYFSQKFSMPDEKGKALLNDIATEELGHVNDLFYGKPINKRCYSRRTKKIWTWKYVY